MKKWLSLLVLLITFTGLTSLAEAKSNLETAKEFLTAVENLATVKEIDAFLSKYLDKSVAEQVKQSDFRKFAWRISRPGEKAGWWVIFEHKKHAIASAYYMFGDPPEDATILQTRGEKS